MRNWVTTGSAVLLFTFSTVVALGKEDGLTSLTGFGVGIFTQSFEISRHFTRPRESDGNYFASRRDKSLLRAQTNDVDLPLSWTLGAGYTYLASPALGRYPNIKDDVISLTGGLDWNPAPSFKMILDLEINNISAENYNRGAFLLQFWQTIPLRPKALPVESVADFDSSEADQYYARQLEEKTKLFALKKKATLGQIESISGKEEEEEFEQYPEVKVGLLLGFGVHLTARKAFRNTSLGTLDVEQKLFQNRIGGEINYLPREGLTFKIGGSVFLYNVTVDSYLPYLEIGTLQRNPLTSRIGWSAATNQSLSFPTWSFDQGFELEINEKEKFGLFLNESLFPSVNQSTLLSAAPAYTRELGKGWKIAVEPLFGLLLKSGPMVSGTMRVSYEL